MFNLKYAEKAKTDDEIAKTEMRAFSVWVMLSIQSNPNTESAHLKLMYVALSNVASVK